jgi:hypothetical protein
VSGVRAFIVRAAEWPHGLRCARCMRALLDGAPAAAVRVRAVAPREGPAPEQRTWAWVEEIVCPACAEAGRAA